MTPFRMLVVVVVLAISACATAPAQEATPRIAIVSAFPPELVALQEATTNRRTETIGGVAFTTGELEGQRVVLFLSGVSMVNAARSAQLAIDHFHVSRIVFSGIAGGVDPSLDVGDVVVAERWGQAMEMEFLREAPGGGFVPHDRQSAHLPAFGMMSPRVVLVQRANGQQEERVWFPADPAMLNAARTIAGGVTLERCATADSCLSHQPRVVVGGTGVSAPVFLDNASFRDYAFRTFEARVFDMESAAVAQVAYINGTPFIAFRALSDLAGGDPGHNQFPILLHLASRNSAIVVRAFLRQLPRN